MASALEGRESFADNEHFSRPSASRNAENVALVSECVQKDRRQILEETVVAPHFSKRGCQGILTEDLTMNRMSQRIVLRSLATEQKKERIIASDDLINKVDKDSGFLQPNHYM